MNRALVLITILALMFCLPSCGEQGAAPTPGEVSPTPSPAGTPSPGAAAPESGTVIVSDGEGNTLWKIKDAGEDGFTLYDGADKLLAEGTIDGQFLVLKEPDGKNVLKTKRQRYGYRLFSGDQKLKYIIFNEPDKIFFLNDNKSKALYTIEKCQKDKAGKVIEGSNIKISGSSKGEVKVGDNESVVMDKKGKVLYRIKGLGTDEKERHKNTCFMGLTKFDPMERITMMMDFQYKQKVCAKDLSPEEAAALDEAEHGGGKGHIRRTKEQREKIKERIEHRKEKDKKRKEAAKKGDDKNPKKGDDKDPKKGDDKNPKT